MPLQSGNAIERWWQLCLPKGLAIDARGNLYVSDGANSRIRMVTAAGLIFTIAGNGTRGYSGDGGAALNAQLAGSNNMTVDASGNLYLTDNNRIRRISKAGIITTVAGTDSAPNIGDGGASH